MSEQIEAFTHPVIIEVFAQYLHPKVLLSLKQTCSGLSNNIHIENRLLLPKAGVRLLKSLVTPENDLKFSWIRSRGHDTKVSLRYDTKYTDITHIRQYSLDGFQKYQEDATRYLSVELRIETHTTEVVVDIKDVIEPEGSRLEYYRSDYIVLQPSLEDVSSTTIAGHLPVKIGGAQVHTFQSLHSIISSGRICNMPCSTPFKDFETYDNSDSYWSDGWSDDENQERPDVEEDIYDAQYDPEYDWEAYQNAHTPWDELEALTGTNWENFDPHHNTHTDWETLDWEVTLERSG